MDATYLNTIIIKRKELY